MTIWFLFNFATRLLWRLPIGSSRKPSSSMQEEGVTLVNVLIVSKWQMRYSIFTFFHCKVNTLYVLPYDIDCHTFVNTLVNNTGVKDQE